MIVERTEHPSWLSNAYLVADGEGGHGVLVDSNGINQPLLDAVERLGVTITHVLVTHHHARSRRDLRGGRPPLRACRCSATSLHATPASTGRDRSRTETTIRSGELEIRVLATPGHCSDHLALLVDGTDCLTADCLFKGTVGGTAGGGPSGYADQIHSIMDVLMSAAAGDANPPGPPRSRPRSARSGSRTRSSGCGAGSTPRDPSLARCGGRQRRSSSGAPTTTARTRRGCAIPTAATRSSADRKSSARSQVERQLDAQRADAAAKARGRRPRHSRASARRAAGGVATAKARRGPRSRHKSSVRRCKN